MRCTNPIRLMHLNPSDYPDGLLVPCGKCLACRIAKRSEWSMRMLHELESYDDAVFVTLTYSDDYLPENASLRKSDLQKFFKRLRKELAKNERRIRYFACGEYGDNTSRPHYHAIIFGLSLRSDDKALVGFKWPFGHCHFGCAEPDSIRYVAQYIDKKYSGDLAKIEYEDKKREPVFRLLSLGLGKNYLAKYGDQVKEMGYCTVKGVTHTLPRYYLQKLDIDPEEARLQSKFKACEDYETVTGLNLDPDVAYRVRPASEYTQYQKTQEAKRRQKDRNLQAKVELKKSKL